MSSSSEDSHAVPKRKRKLRRLEDSPPSTSSGSPILSSFSSRRKKAPRVSSDSSDSESSGSPILTTPRRKVTKVTSDSDSETSDDSDIGRNRLGRPKMLQSENESDGSTSSQWESDFESETEQICQPTASVAEGNVKNGSDSDVSDGQSEKCPICLVSFKTQEIGTPESCDHTFCLECIQEWSKNMNTCPVDRQEYRLILVRDGLNGRVIRRIPVERPTPQNIMDIIEDPTFCEICGSYEHEDRMLLCDGCDLGFHLFCLTPPLEDVPSGSWYCNECSNTDGYNSDTVYVHLTIGYETNENGAERRTISIRRNMSRLVPRTRQTERVRNQIETNRHQNSINSSSPSTNNLVSSSSRRTSQVSSSTTKKKTKRKKKTKSRKRRPTKYRTVYEIDEATGETVARKKRVKQKSRKSRTNRTISRPKKTVKKRLAEQLGICPPRISNQNLPDVKIPNTPSNPSSNISGMRHSAGIPTLRLFGDTNELDYFSEDGEDYSLGSQLLTRRAPNQSDVSAMRRIARRKNIAVPEVVSSTSDLLGSILNSQQEFYSRNASFSLDSSGKFKVENKNSTPKIDVNKEKAVAKETPYYPNNRNYNNRYNQNYRYNQNRYQNNPRYNNSNNYYNNSNNQNYYNSEPSSSMNYGNFSGEDNDYPQDYSQRTLCATAESNTEEDREEEEDEANRNRNSESELDIYSDIETVTTSKADEENELRPPSPPIITHTSNAGTDEDNNDSEGDMVIDDEKVAEQEPVPNEEAAVTSTVGLSRHFEPEFPSNNSGEIQSGAVQSSVQSSSLDEIKNYQYFNDDDSSDGCPNANIYSREAKQPNDEDVDSDDGCPNFSIYSKESKTLALHTDISHNPQVGEVSSSPNIQESESVNNSYDPEQIYEPENDSDNENEQPVADSEQMYDPENIYDQDNSPDDEESGAFAGDQSYDPEKCSLPDLSLETEKQFDADQSYDPEKIYDDDSNSVDKSIDFENEVFNYKAPVDKDVSSDHEITAIDADDGDRYDPAVPFNDDLDESRFKENDDLDESRFKENDEKDSDESETMEKDDKEDKEEGEVSVHANDTEENNESQKEKLPKEVSKPIIKGGILGGLYSDSEDEDLIKKDESGFGLTDINHMTEDISEEERSYTPCLDEKGQKQGLEGLETELISDEDRNDFDESHDLKTQSDGDALEINAKESELDLIRPEDYEEGEIIDKNKEKENEEEEEEQPEAQETVETPTPVKIDKLPEEKRSKKKKEKEKPTTEDKSGNKENEGVKEASFKKLSRSNKERNYRGDKEKDKDKEKRHSSPIRESRSKERDSNRRDRSDKRKEKRKELERYSVRAIISEKPRPLIAKDQFGRDIRDTPSRSRSRSYTPPVRSMRSADRIRSPSVRRSPSRSRRSLSKKAKSPPKEKPPRRRKSTNFRSRSRTRSRSPKKGSASKGKKRRRSDSRFRKKKSGDRSKAKKRIRSRSGRRSRSGTPVMREWVERREWSPQDHSPVPHVSPSWTPPRVLDNSQLLRNEHLTVTVNNSKKKREKKRREKRGKEPLSGRPKRRRRERERTPPPSKEVFASGDNILVSVSFNNDNETRDISTRDISARDKRKLEELNRKRKEKRKKNRKDLTGVKPVAIIDLDRSPFRELTPSPKQVIVLTDSENEENEDNDRNVQDNVCDSSQQVASPERGIGPKTPPEPQVKFSLAPKQPQVRAINNPLHDPDDMETNDHVDDGTTSPGIHIGPNTPPNSPPNSPDAYDPFEPTKSRSPTPDRSLQAQDSQKSIDSRAAIDLLEKSTNPVPENVKSLTPPLADIQPADSQSSIIQVTPDSNLDKSPERPGTVVQQSKPVAQTIPFSSVPTSIITSTPIPSNIATSRINILNSTVIAPTAVSTIPQRIVLPNQIIKSSPVKISPTKMPVKSTPIKPLTKFNRVARKRPQIEEIILDFDSPYSPGSSDYEDLFEPPSEIVTKPVIKTKRPSPQKHASAFDALFGSPSYKQKTRKLTVKKTVSKTKTVGIKLDEDNLKILDDLPNSAVEMQVKDKYLKKLNRQERVVEEVKLVLKPHYNKKRINKEEYKDILRRSVPKICHNKSGEINPTKIKNLIEAYVRKLKHSKKVTSSSSANLQKV